MSPRKSWSFSIVSGWRDTTELSSLTASSTTSRFGAFFRSKIAVLKSLFVPLLHIIIKIQKNNKNTKKQWETFNNNQVIFFCIRIIQSRNIARDLIMSRNTYESDDSGWSVMVSKREKQFWVCKRMNWECGSEIRGERWNLWGEGRRFLFRKKRLSYILLYFKFYFSLYNSSL